MNPVRRLLIAELFLSLYKKGFICSEDKLDRMKKRFLKLWASNKLYNL